MVHRIGLFVASLAAVVVLVLGMSLSGHTIGGQTATQAPNPVVAADPTPRVQVDTVYVAPAKKPPTIVVHKTVGGSSGEDEESEGGDD